MNCPVCKQDIDDDALFCPSCNTHVAERAQEKRLELKRQKMQDSIREGMSGPMFLVLAIALSVIALMSTINCFDALLNVKSAWFSLLVSIAPLVGVIISVVGSWKLYIRKDALNVKDMNKLALYPKIMKIMAIIASVAVGIACGIFLIVVVLLGAILNEASDAVDDIGSGLEDLDFSGAEDLSDALETLLDGGAAFIIIFGLLIVALMMTIVICLIKSYGKTAKFYNELAYATERNKTPYTAAAPNILLWIMGVLVGLTALLTLVNGEIVSGLEMVGVATYFIVNALFFRELNQKVSATTLEIRDEEEKLAKIKEETAAMLAAAENAERKRREEERRQQEEEAKRREEERKRQEAAAQNNQAMMMQAMMAQMMKNMMNNQPDENAEQKKEEN